MPAEPAEPAAAPAGPAGTGFGGHRRVGSLLHVLLQPLAALLIGISLIPPIPFVVGTGIDPSWGVGLHLARRDGLAFGRDVVFTFGPLGFLVAPTMAVPTTGLLAYAVRIPLYGGVAWLVLARLSRLLRARFAVLPAPAAAGLAALGTFPVAWSVVGPLGFGGESIVVPLLVAGALGAERILTAAPWPSTRAHLGLGAAAAAALLTKFDVGLVALVLALLFAVAGAEQRLARLRSTAAGFVATLVVLWLLLGQSLGDLAVWLGRSFDVTTGFSAAMPWAYRPDWTTPVAIVAAVVVAATLVHGRRLHWPLPFGLAYLVVLLGTVTVQSFRRYDPGHVLRFVALLVLLVLLAAGPRSFVPTMAALVLLVVTALGLVQPGPAFPAFGRIRTEIPFVHPSNGWRVAIRTVTFTVSSTRRNGRVQREHDRLGPMLGIPDEVRAVARGRTVHVEPWETSTAWILGLRWRPLPVFQSYSAYTASLDRLNAARLTDGRRAPDVVLTQPLAIDGRVPRWESPEAQLALLCHYRPAASGNNWTAFERRAGSACGTAVTGAPAATVTADGTGVRRGTAEPGQEVRVDAAVRPDAITVVRFRGLAGSPLTGWFGQPPRITLEGGGPQRLLAATAGGPHVLALPDCLRAALGPGAGYDASTWRSFVVTGADLYTYEIETIPYECSRP